MGQMMEDVERHDMPLSQPGWLHPTRFLDWLGQPDPKIVWLVKGLVPASSLCMLSGPRKRAYKTYLAMLIALIHAFGFKWWEWTAEEPGNVLFLEEESTQGENKRRFRNLMDGIGLTGVKPKGEIFFQLHSRFKLDDPKMVFDLIKFVKTNHVNLVILDAITYMQRGNPN